MSGTTISEYHGRRGVWAQGEAVFYPVEDAAAACVAYRQDMAAAIIAIETHPPVVDALRVRAAQAELARLRPLGAAARDHDWLVTEAWANFANNAPFEVTEEMEGTFFAALQDALARATAARS